MLVVSNHTHPMNADLTFNSVVFKKSFDEKGGSERRSTARGINTPDLLIIKKTAYVDSVTKVPGFRYLVRVDYQNVTAEGVTYVVSAYTVIAVPSIAIAGDMTTILATYKAAVADASLIAGVLNSET